MCRKAQSQLPIFCGDVFEKLLAIIGLILLLPAAHAGSAADPEISDPIGDVTWDGDRLIPTPYTQTAAIDCVASWFHDESTTDIKLTMQVADLSRVDEFESSYARWGTRFELSNYVPDSRESSWSYTWVIAVQFNNGPPGWRAEVQAPDRGGESPEADVPFTMDLSTNSFTVVIPRTALGSPGAGDRMKDLLSLHDADVLEGPLLGTLRGHHNDQSGGENNERGRDYVFQFDSARDAASEASSSEGISSTTAVSKATASSDPKEAPAFAPLTALAMLLLVALRRRQSSK